jgi:hypothetical protein
MNRPVTVLALVILVAGCATKHEPGSYVYRAPVVVTVTGLSPTNGYCVASVAVTNVSEFAVWFDGWDARHPVYSLEWKGRYYGVPIPPDEGSCVGGGDPCKLPPGQSCSFTIRVHRQLEQLEPFRVGVWAWPSLGESFPIQVFWSGYVSK